MGSWGLAAVLLAALLPMADSFIVNVALPTIAADLAAGAGEPELVVAGYVLAFTVFLVLSGRLGDAHGRRRVLVAGLVGFTLASLLCALATTAEWLVAARVLQGATAALIPPQVLGTIAAALDEERRPRAMSLFAVVSGLAAILGLVLGGVLVHADLLGTSWRLVFLVNLPLGVVAVALALLCVPETRSPLPVGVDLRGTALLAALVVAVLVALNRGGWAWLLLAAVPVLAAALWRVEQRVAAPLLPPAVLTEPRVRGGLLLLAPFLAAWAGYLFALPLTLQQGLGLDPVEAALVVAPMPVAFMAASFAVPALRRRVGDRAFAAGVLLQGAGAGWLLESMLLGAPVLVLLPGLVLVGSGQGFAIGSSQISVLGAVPAEHAGVGGGVLVTVQQGSMAVGVAALGGLFGTLLPAGHQTAFAAVLATQLVIALTVALLSARTALPSSQVG